MAASRAKLTMLNTMSKIRGQVKNPGYPQSEGLLGECMIRYGKELGEDSNFGECPLGEWRAVREAPDSLPGCHSEFWKGLGGLCGTEQCRGLKRGSEASRVSRFQGKERRLRWDIGKNSCL